MKLKIKTIISALALMAGMFTFTLDADALHTPLHGAAEEGNLEQAEALCEKNPEFIYERDEHGCTPLHYAVKSLNFELVKYLVECGADIDAKDDCNITPIACASDLKTAKYFVECGADLNLALYTAASTASSVGNLDVVKYLLEQPDVNVNHVVFLSIFRNNQQALDCLIDLGADVNGALFISASLENMDFVKHLIEEKCADAQSAIAAAISAGNVDLIEYLVSKGADLNKRDSEGNTLLQALLRVYEAIKVDDVLAHNCKRLEVSIDYLRSKGVEE